MTEGVVRSAGGGRHSCNFCDVICINNLFSAWKEFRNGKRSHKDVGVFELQLEENLFQLYESLANGSFRLDPYKVSIIQDPKLRTIHIASVRDRVLFQAVYRKLYHVFDPIFIHDIYSSRNLKGTHVGANRLETFLCKITQNFTRSAFVLKCDIRKFFDSIDHDVLFDIISNEIRDQKLLHFLKVIIDSLNSSSKKGLPLGNVTSQLFANIYLNEFDHFVKHELKAEYYIRYCDDFVILNRSHEVLDSYISRIAMFLKWELKLELHPRKTTIRKTHRGVDFLGYVSLPYFRVLRTSTKNRMLRKIDRAKLMYERGIIGEIQLANMVFSYLGMLSHCKSEKITAQIERIFWD